MAGRALHWWKRPSCRAGLDSIGILDLMMHLGDRFGVEVDEDSFDLANFASVDTLAHFIDDRRSDA